MLNRGCCKLFNSCLEYATIPHLWRKSKVIAIPKPGKPADNPKNVLPILLLCHSYKLFVRLLLACRTSLTDPNWFRSKRGSDRKHRAVTRSLEIRNASTFCIGKDNWLYICWFVSSLRTQWTLDSYCGMWKPWPAIIKLSWYSVKFSITVVIRSIFFIQDRSRCRSQNSGLTLGSVLAPLFLIYILTTNHSVQRRPACYTQTISL